MLKMNSARIDALREIVNISSGNAATALSEILKKKIDMNIPVIEIRKLQDVVVRLGKEDEAVFGTLIKVLGDVSGSVLLVVKETKAKSVAYRLLEEIVDEYDEDMVLSVFQEVGNILGNSYLNAMGSVLDMNLFTSVPYISNDMLFSIISSAYIDANSEEDYVIDIGCTLYENNVKFDLNIFFIINNASLEAILNKVDRMLNGDSCGQTN